MIKHFTISHRETLMLLFDFQSSFVSVTFVSCNRLPTHIKEIWLRFSLLQFCFINIWSTVFKMYSTVPSELPWITVKCKEISPVIYESVSWNFLCSKNMQKIAITINIIGFVILGTIVNNNKQCRLSSALCHNGLYVYKAMQDRWLMCMFMSFHLKGLLLSRMIPETCIRVQINNVMLRTLLQCLCQIPLSLILNLPYFTYKEKTLAQHYKERKWYDIWRYAKMDERIYIWYRI